MAGGGERRGIAATGPGLLALLAALAGCDAHPVINYAARPMANAPPPRVVAQPGRPAPAAQPPAAEAPILAPPPDPIQREVLPPPGLAFSPEPEEAAPAAPPVTPPADPAERMATLLRGNPWLTRFWSELDATQRARVRRGLQAGRPPQLDTEMAAAWDRMGLGERIRLLYGAGA